MYKRLKVKLYPNKQQKEVLDNHFNAYRFCYNLCLEYSSVLWRDYKKRVSGYDMQKELFVIRKDTEWLSKCKAECLRDAALQVNSSLLKFYKGNGYPKFKSKKGKQSFSSYQAIKCIDDRLRFYGNFIKFRTSKKYVSELNSSTIKQVTFKKDSCGDYFATFLIEFQLKEKNRNSNNIIGVDLGIKTLIITSDGSSFENKKYFIKSEKKLRRLTTSIHKKEKKSNNRIKAKLKAAKLYRKIRRQREHYYHAISNELIRNNQTIIIETLRIKNMIKNKKLSKSIIDASWGLLISFLDYKSKWNNRSLIKIDAFYPSSKTCSSCGNVKEVLSLSERNYKCYECGLTIDRDINAAINIKQIGIKMPEFKPVECFN